MAGLFNQLVGIDRYRTLLLVIMAWSAVCGAPHAATAQPHRPLDASGVLVLANRDDPASMRVADRYMALRQIPQANRVDLPLPQATDISRQTFDRRIADPLRRHLRDRPTDPPIRCIVLSYNLPLRIKPGEPDSFSDSALRKLRLDQHRTVRQVLRSIHRLNQIASDQPADQPPAPAEPDERLAVMIQRARQAHRAACLRVQKLGDTLRQAKARRSLLKHQVELFGPASLVAALRAGESDHIEPSARLKQLADQVAAAELAMTLLQRKYDEPARDQARRLANKYFGLIGLLGQFDTELNRIRLTDGAAVDSDLALLHWADQAPVAGRMINPAAYRFEKMRDQFDEPPVLIVARLQASSEQTVMRMLADAIAIERRGLRGRAYIDARGTEKPGYRAYDRSLLNLANRLQTLAGDSPRGGPIEQVTVDRREKLMPPHAGQWAALYCGWYAVRGYNAPLEFTRGAVGYHIASFEATDFRPGTREWAANLLEAGCAVTLGAVAEPYLDAFPVPDDFFQLLMTGRYTVGEVYLMTSKYASWQMVLCGDPLYNPFARKPAMSMAQLDLAMPVFDPLPDRAVAAAQAVVDRVERASATAISSVPVD